MTVETGALRASAKAWTPRRNASGSCLRECSRVDAACEILTKGTGRAVSPLTISSRMRVKSAAMRAMRSGWNKSA